MDKIELADNSNIHKNQTRVVLFFYRNSSLGLTLNSFIIRSYRRRRE